jgi:hypothetical protein
MNSCMQSRGFSYTQSGHFSVLHPHAARARDDGARAGTKQPRAPGHAGGRAAHGVVVIVLCLEAWGKPRQRTSGRADRQLGSPEPAARATDDDLRRAAARTTPAWSRRVGAGWRRTMHRLRSAACVRLRGLCLSLRCAHRNARPRGFPAASQTIFSSCPVSTQRSFPSISVRL